jgi:iron complex outermembrane receptor protein
MISSRIALAPAVCLAAAASLWAPPARAQDGDLTKLALQDLLEVEVTSVARKPQTLARTAAAVQVITREDIRRSGAQSIPDLLRLVPGFTVAQIDAGSYAVSARGFTAMYSNKLLVLIDGRSVYTPMFGGVHWDMQNLPLADIDRIEVVRGPGGSVWGANATNGVINIITKAAAATQGALIALETGGDERADLQLRYGSTLGDSAHYRLWTRRVERGWKTELQGVTVGDPAEATIAGARIDWDLGADRLALHGSAQQGHSDRVRSLPALPDGGRAAVRERTDFDDANVVFSWSHITPASEFGVQAYYEHLFRRASLVFDDRWHTADVDARFRHALGRRHDLVAGGGVRVWSNSLENHAFAVFPEAERVTTLSAFAQDEVEIARDRLRATLGIKLEHNRYTAAGAQPSARITWLPREGHAVWAAAARAVRTPTRTDIGLRLPVDVTDGPFGLPLVVLYQGNPAFQPETLHAFEAGYRMQRGRASIDVAGFLNDYGGIQTSERLDAAPADIPGVGAAWTLPLVFVNGPGGRTSGVEVSGTWSIAGWWRLMGAWSSLAFDMDPTAYAGLEAATGEALTPGRQSHLRTYLDLPGHVDASVMLFRVGALSGIDAPAYTRLDLRIAWTRGPLELAAGAHNIGHPRRPEFVEGSGVQPVLYSPRAFAQAAVRFKP